MFIRDFRRQVLLFSTFALASLPAQAAHYTVRPGDNLTKISRRVGVRMKTLRRLNPGLDVLQPGQKIRLAGGSDSPSASRKSRAARPKTERTALRSRRQKARLAKWAKYKKLLAKKRAVAANRKRTAAAKRKRQIAAWKAYQKQVKKKRQVAAWNSYKKKAQQKRKLAAWKSYRASRAKKRIAARTRQKMIARKRLAQYRHYNRKKMRTWQAYQNKRRRMWAKVRRERNTRRYSRVARQRGQVRRRYADLPKYTEARQGGSDSGNKGLIRTAMAYRGARYVWGATGNGAFDCSGFTRFVYRRAAGMTLPRTSRQQFGVGERVSRKSLKPGDLLFFNTNRRGVSHVGIYTGNGKFVHAANPRRGVTTDSVNSRYYGRRMVGARRVMR